MEDRTREGRSLSNGDAGTEDRERGRSRTPEDIWGEERESAVEVQEEENERYSENGSAVKRRRVEKVVSETDHEGEKGVVRKDRKVSGPFIDESDSEEENLDAFRDWGDQDGETKEDEAEKEESKGLLPLDGDQTAKKRDFVDVPPLVREATSHIPDDDYPDFDDIDENEGQRDLVLDGADDNGDVDDAFEFDANEMNADALEVDEEPTCPVCQGSLEGLDELVSQLHCVLLR